MLGTGLVRCTERERENGQSGASLLHACVTDFAGRAGGAPEVKDLAADRLRIAAVRKRVPSLEGGIISNPSPVDVLCRTVTIQ